MSETISLDKLVRFYRELNNEIEKSAINPNDYKEHVLFGNLDLKFRLERAYIKDSPLHGKGVFAKTPFKKGDIITFYPAHFIFSYPGRDDLVGLVKIKGAFSRIVSDNNLTFTDEIRFTYSYEIDDKISICGHPQLIDDQRFLGHMVNDAIKGKSTLKDLDPLDEKYYEDHAPLKNNSIILNLGDFGLCVAIVALRDIRIDEEITTCYGYKYWTFINSI